VIDGEKHTSLLQYGTNYGRESFIVKPPEQVLLL